MYAVIHYNLTLIGILFRFEHSSSDELILFSLAERRGKRFIVQQDPSLNQTLQLKVMDKRNHTIVDVVQWNYAEENFEKIII